MSCETNISNGLFHACSIHGIPVNISNMEQALIEVETLIKLQQHHYVCFFEGNLFARSIREKEVHDVISAASLVYPDGIIIAKELEWNTKKKASRVSGPAFLLKACEYGIKHNWRHFFLGGEDGVAQKIAMNLLKKYPDLEIAGYYTPPFRELNEEEELQIKHEIENNHTDLLWVGLGGPKQEFWMRKHLNTINVPVMLGVGAAFDFHSGNRPWAPPIIRKMGFEWLYRMLRGGKRTFLRNVKCLNSLFNVLLNDKFSSYRNKTMEIIIRPPNHNTNEKTNT